MEKTECDKDSREQKKWLNDTSLAWNPKSLNFLQRQVCYNYHPGRVGVSKLLRFHTLLEVEEEVAA